MPGGLYGFKSGTSMATPHVTGAVALLMSTDVSGTSYDANKNGKWDPAEVRSRMQKTATDLGTTGKDDYYGYGLVNAYAAVNGLENAPADNIPTEDDIPETGTNPDTTPTGPAEISMFVSSLTATADYSFRGINTFCGTTVTARIIDSNGKPVPGATVSGSWSGLTSSASSEVTDTEGIVEFTSSFVKNPEGIVTFEITGISCRGYSYDPEMDACSTVSIIY
jgi:subtilisin